MPEKKIDPKKPTAEKKREQPKKASFAHRLQKLSRRLSANHTETVL